MCRRFSIESFRRSESPILEIEILTESEPESSISWPLRNNNVLIYACKYCYHPITYVDRVSFSLVSTTARATCVGLVVPMNYLFTEDFAGMSDSITRERWRIGIWCFGCGALLSFFVAPPIIEEYRSSDNVVVLDRQRLEHGLALDLHLRFIEYGH